MILPNTPQILLGSTWAEVAKYGFDAHLLRQIRLNLHVGTLKVPREALEKHPEAMQELERYMQARAEAAYPLIAPIVHEGKGSITRGAVVVAAETGVSQKHVWHCCHGNATFTTPKVCRVVNWLAENKGFAWPR